ncbi:MAG: isochorismate synthase [Ilumatobacteraceae bacterium]
MAEFGLVTREIDSESARKLSLEAVCGRDGFLFARGDTGVAGRGVIEQVPFAAVLDLQSSLGTPSVDGAPGAVLFVAVNFDGRSGNVTLPRICVRRATDGRTWLHAPHDVTVDDVIAEVASDKPGGRDASVRSSSTTPAPDVSFTVRPGVPVATYLAAVGAARNAVAQGRLAKAVIARNVIVESTAPFDVPRIVDRLRRNFGSSYRFHFNGLVGASPELLVERDGATVRSHPLAGTTTRTGDPRVDAQLAAELLASSKNQLEHRVVIDMVHDTLLPWCSYLDWQPEAEVVAVANVQHLGTRVEGRLGDPPPPVTDLVRALVPTPALGGHPRDAAMDFIGAHEGFDRGRYGGAVGWMDASGDGTFAVTIRCGIIDETGSRAELYAGGGIVAGSEPLLELDETRAKFQAMLSVFVRP